MRWSRATGVTILAWVAAALCLAWALMRTFGLEVGFPLQAIVAWTPFVVPFALIVAVLAAVIARWPQATMAALAFVLLVAAVAPRAFGGGYHPDGADGPELRVMSANLKLGKADPEDLVALVRDQEPDVLCVQELTPELELDLRDAGLTDVLPNWIDLSGASSSGSGIYTRHNLRDLGSSAPAGYPFVMPTARIDIEGSAVRVVSVHTVPPTGSHAVETWEEGLDALPEGGAATPTLLVGDFNATLDHAAFRDLIDRGYVDAGDATGAGLEPTWPQDKFRPWVTIDHVLADERVAIDDYEVLSLLGSDHHAIAATLRLPGD